MRVELKTPEFAVEPRMWVQYEQDPGDGAEPRLD